MSEKKKESGILDGTDQSNLFPHCVLNMGWNQMRPRARPPARRRLRVLTTFLTHFLLIDGGLVFVTAGSLPDGDCGFSAICQQQNKPFLSVTAAFVFLLSPLPPSNDIMSARNVNKTSRSPPGGGLQVRPISPAPKSCHFLICSVDALKKRS